MGARGLQGGVRDVWTRAYVGGYGIIRFRGGSRFSQARFLRACLEIGRGAAAGDFGAGRGGASPASPQRAAGLATTKSGFKRTAARRVFAAGAAWPRCSSVEDPSRVFSLVAPCHPAPATKTAPLRIFRQALRRPTASPTELRASVRSLGIMPNARPVAHVSSPDIQPLKLILCVQICTRSSPNGNAETTAPKNDNVAECSILTFCRGVKGCGVLTAFIKSPRNISAPCADGCNRKSAVRGITSIPRPTRSPARGESRGFTSGHACCGWYTGTRFCGMARHGVMPRSGLPRSLSKNRSNRPFRLGLHFSFIR